jgi:hypothetical protein
MPLFIDIHEIPGVTSEVAAAEHIKDIEAQGPFAVDYSRYWLNEATGKIFCLCEAPTADAAIAVHRQAHGVAADRIIEVSGELADLFMGPTMTDAGGAVILPTDLGHTHDTGTRTLLFTDIVESIALTNRLGDEGAMEVLAVHDEIVRAAIAQNGGREVKHTGDGIMAAFISAIGAVRCAVDSQRGRASPSVVRHSDRYRFRRPGRTSQRLLWSDGAACCPTLRSGPAGTNPVFPGRRRPLRRQESPLSRMRPRSAQRIPGDRRGPLRRLVVMRAA